jgi:heme exporter protein D
MRKSFVFLAFFCAIVVIDGNFIHDVFRRGADLGAHLQQAQQPNQQGQAQGQGTGQPDQQAQGQQTGQQGAQGQQQDQQGQQGMQGQNQQEPIDCFKFNTDSQLSSDKVCLPTTTTLRNATHWAFCDNALEQTSQSQQQSSPIQGGGATGAPSNFIHPIVACQIDAQGVLTCLPKDQAQNLSNSTQGGSSPTGIQQTSPGTSQAQVSSTKGSQADIIGKTFTNCFLYAQSELIQQGLEEEEQVQYMCVRRKPKRATTGVAGQPAQQGQQGQQPPPQQSPSQPPPQQPPPKQQPPSQTQQQSQSQEGGGSQSQSQSQKQDSKKNP